MSQTGHETLAQLRCGTGPGEELGLSSVPSQSLASHMEVASNIHFWSDFGPIPRQISKNANQVPKSLRALQVWAFCRFKAQEYRNLVFFCFTARQSACRKNR